MKLPIINNHFIDGCANDYYLVKHNFKGNKVPAIQSAIWYCMHVY